MKHTAQQICHVNLAGGFRGGERQTELLVRELAARGWPQRLVVRAGSALAARCAGIPGLDLREVAPNPVSAAWGSRGCALLHAHEERAVHSGWLLKRCTGTPYLLTRRVHHVNSASLGRRLAWRAADRVVAVSESIARSLTGPYADIPVTVVPDAHAGLQDANTGVPDAQAWVRDAHAEPGDAHVEAGDVHAEPGDARAGARGVLAELAGKTIVGHVGELDHHAKGQGTIIEAARMLRESRPELHFVLVGKGSDEARFRSEASGLDNLQLVGFVDNVGDYLAAFDLFVYPSQFEGLGSTLLDAMAFGLPIVASRVGGIPEVVEDGVNGLLIPPERPGELADALVKLLDDAGLRESMARENVARAARFSPARMTDAYEAIYRSILDPA